MVVIVTAYGINMQRYPAMVAYCLEKFLEQLNIEATHRLFWKADVVLESGAA